MFAVAPASVLNASESLTGTESFLCRRATAINRQERGLCCFELREGAARQLAFAHQCPLVLNFLCDVNTAENNN